MKREENQHTVRNTEIPGDESSRILTPKDVSKRLGMGINQTRALIRRKDFPKIMVGKKALIPEEALEQWLKDSLYKSFPIKG